MLAVLYDFVTVAIAPVRLFIANTLNKSRTCCVCRGLSNEFGAKGGRRLWNKQRKYCIGIFDQCRRTHSWGSSRTLEQEVMVHWRRFNQQQESASGYKKCFAQEDHFDCYSQDSRRTWKILESPHGDPGIIYISQRHTCLHQLRCIGVDVQLEFLK